MEKIFGNFFLINFVRLTQVLMNDTYQADDRLRHRRDSTWKRVSQSYHSAHKCACSFSPRTINKKEIILFFLIILIIYIVEDGGEKRCASTDEQANIFDEFRCKLWAFGKTAKLYMFDDFFIKYKTRKCINTRRRSVHP